MYLLTMALSFFTKFLIKKGLIYHILVYIHQLDLDLINRYVRNQMQSKLNFINMIS